MVYLDILYVSLLTRKQHVKYVADRLGCRISIKMASQPCGGTIANIADTVRVFADIINDTSAFHRFGMNAGFDVFSYFKYM